jgi:hypothetical protein
MGILWISCRSEANKGRFDGDLVHVWRLDLLGFCKTLFMAGPVQRRFGFAQVVMGVLWMYVVFWLVLVALPAPLVIGLITTVLFFLV